MRGKGPSPLVAAKTLTRRAAWVAGSPSPQPSPIQGEGVGPATQKGPGIRLRAAIAGSSVAHIECARRGPTPGSREFFGMFGV